MLLKYGDVSIHSGLSVLSVNIRKINICLYVSVTRILLLVPGLIFDGGENKLPAFMTLQLVTTSISFKIDFSCYTGTIALLTCVFFQER